MLAACGREQVAAPSSPSPPSGWGESARLDAVAWGEGEVVVSGRAPPGARVALSTRDGGTWAAVAGPDGDFEVRLAPSEKPILYRSEIQSVSGGAWSGDWLAITPGVDGVAAVLRPGASTRSLPRSPQAARLLAVVDHDGAAALVSGAASPGAMVRVQLDERTPMTVQADAEGRYLARFIGVSEGAHRLRVVDGDQAADAVFTLSRPDGETFDAVRQANGTRIDWPLPGGGGQGAWIAHERAGP